MKLKPLLAAAIVFTATPAFAAPQWVEDACWRYAHRVTPYLSCARTGSLPYKLHSRLDGWNAAAPGPQKLLPQQIRLT